MGIYTQTATIALLITNDVHYMHFLAKGEDFDKIHNLAEDYYTTLQEEVDYLYELALEHDEPIVNFSQALAYVQDYETEADKEYNYQMLVERLIYRLGIYVSHLQILREECHESNVESYLDDIIRTWNKEIQYKLQRRLKSIIKNM